jgi:biopolymer transport protein ExbB/TolQ
MGAIAEAFKEGGWGMWPILTVCVITLYLIVDRVMYLAKSKVNVEQLMSVVKSQIVAGNLRGAISTCDAQPIGTTKILAAGLRKAEQGGAEHEIQQSMDEEALRELPKIEKRTGYLAMLGNLATLCGLLGTITGLIKSFASVAGVDPSMKATMLSKGISEAMNCTAFGLLVAIPALVAYSVLQGRTQHMLDDINESSVSVLNLIIANRDKMKMPAAVSEEAVA